MDGLSIGHATPVRDLAEERAAGTFFDVFHMALAHVGSGALQRGAVEISVQRGHGVQGSRVMRKTFVKSS
jgi:hypothetical protein